MRDEKFDTGLLDLHQLAGSAISVSGAIDELLGKPLTSGDVASRSSSRLSSSHSSGVAEARARDQLLPLRFKPVTDIQHGDGETFSKQTEGGGDR